MNRKLTKQEKIKLRYLKESLKLYGKTKRFPMNLFYYLFHKSYLEGFVKGLELFLKLSVKDFKEELEEYKFALDKQGESKC